MCSWNIKRNTNWNIVHCFNLLEEAIKKLMQRECVQHKLTQKWSGLQLFGKLNEQKEQETFTEIGMLFQTEKTKSVAQTHCQCFFLKVVYRKINLLQLSAKIITWDKRGGRGSRYKYVIHAENLCWFLSVSDTDTWVPWVLPSPLTNIIASYHSRDTSKL